MTSIYHWLVLDGLNRDLLASTIGTVIGLTAARVVTLRPLRRHTQLQEKISDQLDTTTPGGLGTVHQQLLDVHDHLTKDTDK